MSLINSLNNFCSGQNTGNNSFLQESITAIQTEIRRDVSKSHMPTSPEAERAKITNFKFNVINHRDGTLTTVKLICLWLIREVMPLIL